MKYTQLINKTNKWNEKYFQKTEWEETNNIEGKKVLVEKETYSHFKGLQQELKKLGIQIDIISSYRSIEEQEQIRKEILLEKKEEYLSNYVASPQTSEHHTGLALDIAIIEGNKVLKRDSKEAEEIYQILHQHLNKFGFIVRYPKGKEKETGYFYKPWHIRYVGEYPATIMMENNLTLEEYLQKFGAVLYINKPKNLTSFDVVNEISKQFGIKKVGHTGTLDSLATGVMIVAVGKATKIVELLTAQDKEYVSEVQLGIETDTYDIEGEIINQKEEKKLLPIEKVLKSYQKTYLQEVPIYSAVKVNGRKLYDYARKKIEVELPKKEVTIKEIELLKEEKDSFTFRTLVTKGCYIRSLIHDIAKTLGTYATMKSLKRTKQGDIPIEKTNTLEEFKKQKAIIHSIEEVLNYPKVEVDNSLEAKIRNGVKIENKWNMEDKVIFKNKEGILLGIYETEGLYLKTWKNFN